MTRLEYYIWRLARAHAIGDRLGLLIAVRIRQWWIDRQAKSAKPKEPS
jgi:hypothetical protein